MLYINKLDTQSLLHVDLCASIGNNIMVDGDGKVEWYFIHPEDFKKAEGVIEREQRRLNRNLDTNIHYGTPVSILNILDKLKEKNVRVYKIVQEKWDLVLVPSHCIHQVYNKVKYKFIFFLFFNY